MSCDLALRYDTAQRCCDLVYDGNDWTLDTTPATPMLVAMVAHRRANTDDDVPSPVASPLTPSSLVARGGWPGDALDGQGRLTGSRLWLLDRAKATASTLQLAAAYAAEGLEQVEADRGIAIALKAAWSPLKPPGGKYLILDALAGTTAVQVEQAIGS